MWLHLRSPEQCGFKSHQVPTFSGVGIRKYTFFRSNIDHMRFCYGLICVMWLHLRAPEQCGFKSHQVPTFSGVGIRKYTFFRPNIDHMRFSYALIRVMWLHLRPPEQCGFKSHQVRTFSGVGIRKYTFFRPNIDICLLLLYWYHQFSYCHRYETFHSWIMHQFLNNLRSSRASADHSSNRRLLRNTNNTIR